MGIDNIIAEFAFKLEDVGGIRQSRLVARTQLRPGPGHVDLASQPTDELGPLFANFLYLYFLIWLSYFQCFMMFLKTI